jgi:membrane protein implicated in regulation of membrane protease activity
MNPAYIWLILAFALMAAEIVGTDFFLLFLGSAALVTAIVTFVAGDLSFSAQCIIFGVLALIMVAVWLVRHTRTKGGADSAYSPNAGVDSLNGTETEVAEVGSDGSFKIVVKDSVCLAESGGNETFAVGDRVRIVSIDPKTSRPVVRKV